VPKTEMYEKKQWFSSRPANGEVVMFSDSIPEEEFSYQTHKSQIKYLQYLAMTARQRITIHCKNVVAVFDSGNSTYDQAIRLVSFDEEEMEVHGKKAFRYKVVEDNCQERNGQWGTATIEVRGKEHKLNRIPVMDVGFKDVAGSDQEFGIELGKACFSS
jgi:collagen type I/II/III/V/XI/XXIV/XXVII alpha